MKTSEKYLPFPTEHELQLGNKVLYFNRMFQEGQHVKNKITPDQLASWIHTNYSSICGNHGPLSYTKSLKAK